MKKRKTLKELTVGEVIELLKKSPKKLRKTPHTRIGLIAWLFILYTKAFTACDRKARERAGDYLEWLRNNGSDDEKILLTGLHVAG